MSLVRYFYVNTGLKGTPIKQNKQKLSVAFTAERNEAGEQVVAYGVSVCHPIDAKKFTRQVGRSQADVQLKNVGTDPASIYSGHVIFPSDTNLDEIPGLIVAVFEMKQKQKINTEAAAKAAAVKELESQIEGVYVEIEKLSAQINELYNAADALGTKRAELLYGPSED